jgi:cellulose synthase/poly-beta-1,6-N-acetylglucosamine synthase-like glycosyltransferase
VLSWSILILPFALSLVNARLAALFIITFLLVWFVRAMGLATRVLQGWSTMQKHEKYDWNKMLDELEKLDAKGLPAGRQGHSEALPEWHYANIERLKTRPTPLKPSDIVHAIIMATHNESREILEPTIRSVLASKFDTKKVIFVLAYEERGGPEVEAQAKRLVEDYKSKFKYAIAIKHPDGIPNEVRGKGGNITYAGRMLQKYLEESGIDPHRVMVTTLDADNRPHPYYLSALTYLVAVSPDPIHVSYQPIPIFTNNIWDAPAPMRVIATGNSFWMVVQALRPHMLRNFSSHAQSMQALIDTDFWSVRTVVEDGHQFWRSYFRYEGKYEVYPIFLPIYQDAVLAETYRKTFKEQFIQLRRWAWGASDIAYVVDKGFFHKNNIPLRDRIIKLLRLIEGHLSWATAPLILLFAAFIPVLFNHNDYGANLLPLVASRIQTVALIGVIVTLFLSFKVLPPKPARYKKRRNVWMVLQWVLLPVAGICFNSAAALNAQTRLIFGKYLDRFDATKKAVKTDNHKTIV